MPPGGGGSEHGCTAQDHPPTTARRDEDAPPHSTPPLPAIAPVASEEKQQEQQPTASLPEGPLVEILARVPYRSLCRFKCVSKAWLALCSSRDIRKRSPQTLSGLFYYENNILKFVNLSGRGPPLVDPSLPFLRESCRYIRVEQLCGGLLLCTCSKLCSKPRESDYVVCNPATEEWTVLPPILYSGNESSHLLSPYLGFDAAVPSRFVVFAPLRGGGNESRDMAIYSSESGQWTYVLSKWASRTPADLCHSSETRVLLNSIMYWPTFGNSIFTVDLEGKVWREIKMPNDLPYSLDEISIGQSQGHLCAWQRDNPRDRQLYFWVLEDYSTGKWTLRHIVNTLELFGRHCGKVDNYYEMIAVHPHCNVIFLTDHKTTLSYDLDNHKVDVICTKSMYGLPYIPCFVELPSAGHWESV